MADNQEKRKRQNDWDWLDTEANFLSRRQSAYLSDLMISGDLSSIWRPYRVVIEKEGGIYE